VYLGSWACALGPNEGFGVERVDYLFKVLIKIKKKSNHYLSYIVVDIYSTLSTMTPCAKRALKKVMDMRKSGKLRPVMHRMRGMMKKY
jgi:hypothetical protein